MTVILLFQILDSLIRPRNDFHLRSDSPAFAAGANAGALAGELDLDGAPRAKSGKVDIGCYQKQ
jgi:hypothetical protein